MTDTDLRTALDKLKTHPNAEGLTLPRATAIAVLEELIAARELLAGKVKK